MCGCLPTSLNHEAIIPRVHGRIRFINGGNACAARALRQMALQFLQGYCIANRVNLHVAVPEVLNVPANSELRRPPIREIAIPDTLDAPRDQEFLGDFWSGLGH